MKLKRLAVSLHLVNEMPPPQRALGEVLPHSGEAVSGELSYGQRALWFLQQLDPASTAYNVAHALRIRSPLTVGLVRDAWQSLTDRHAVLRTSFSATASGPIQTVHPRWPVDFVATDARTWSARDLDDHMQAEVYRPFDLACPSQLRVRLLQRADDDYVLLLVLHHIVCDLWSLGLMLVEVPHLYQAAMSGAPSPLPPLRRQYADFVRSQVASVSGPEGDRLWSYWRDRLDGATPLIDLPTDRPRPAVATDRAAAASTTLGADLVRSLRAVAADADASLQELVFSAFQVLLHRYTGQDDFVVDSPRAGRTADAAAVIGYFVNPVPVRVRCHGDPTFAEFLGRTAREIATDFAHGACPFPLIVERLQPERDPRRPPLFQVMFAWQKTSRLVDRRALAAINAGEAGVRFESAGIPFESVDFSHRSSVMELVLHMMETDEGLVATLEYNTALFDSVTAARLLGHIETLLTGIVAHPHARLSELPMLTAAEGLAARAGGSDGTRTRDASEGLLHRFARQVADTPDDDAVSFLGHALTYTELNTRANRLAHHLRRLGVTRNARVGICLERSPDMTVAVLATLKAGGAYVPLDPTYPRERLRFMAIDADPVVLITQKRYQDVVEFPSQRTVCLDQASVALEACPSDTPGPDANLDDLAYVIYTSGSSGRPKGVAMTHRPLANLVEWQVRTTPRALRTLQFAPLSFDVSFQEMFSTWCSGGELVLVDDDTRRDSRSLLHYLYRQHIERLHLPFVALQGLADAAVDRDAPVPDALRTVCAAGEQLIITPAIRQLFRRLPACTLENHYGPTETHVVTAHTLTGSAESWPTYPPIGLPLPSTQVYVLDAHRQPLPTGVPGELYVGGVCLSQGYLNQPALTSERFPARLAWEGVEVDGTRTYRTGDRARWRNDGVLEFLGRSDDQVKIRGFRVEPSEIEAVLMEHPSVRAAVVIASAVVGTERAERRLVAFAVPRDGAERVPVDHLREYLSARVPDYMVPAAFVWQDASVLTASGKVDRRALPVPDWSALFSDSVPPRTPIEETLAAMWVEVLGVPRVGVRDNFFELGGHSLLATQVASRIRATFGVDLPLRTLFEAQTIEALAAPIEGALEGHRVPLPPMRPAPRGQAVPLSFSQERMWFVHQLDSHNAAYNVPGVVRLKGSLRSDDLRRSFEAIVQRHESLRTTFAIVGGQPTQRIDPDARLDWQDVDVSELPADAREREAERQAEEEIRRPFDLLTGPLMRVRLVHLADDDHLLVFNMHHTVSDAWSLRVLLHELKAHHQATLTGQPVLLPDLPMQYADYAVWQREWLQGPALDDQLTYWREQLHGLTPLELPTDHPRPARQSYRGSFVARDLPEPLMRALRVLSRSEGTSLFMTLFAAFALVLRRYTGREDVAVGVPIANRHHLASENIIGSLVNTLVMRVDLSGTPSVRALLGRVREMALGAYAHQDMPFAKLVAELHPGRDLSHSPVVQVMFNVINVPMSTAQFQGLQLEFPIVDRGASQFDVTMTVVDLPVMQRVAIEYNTDLFERATVERMLGHFTTLLEGMAEYADRSIAELPVLTGGERRAILEDWNATAVAYDCDRGLHDVFEARVARDPGATALVHDGRRMSFGELNARSNRIAHALAALGVGSGSLVAVCHERAFDLVAALLAILKTGAAYVPLDPTYPKDRLAYVLSDSAATVLLTERRVLATLPPSSARAICLDSEWSVLSDAPATNLGVTTRGDDLAYAIYTSGSTGMPKGVLATHRGALNRLEWMWTAYPFAAEDVCCQKTALSFVDSVWEIFGPLLGGVPLVLVPEAVGRDPQRLVALLAAERVTHLVLVPSLLKAILDAPVELGTRWPQLRLCVSSGEALSQELAHRFRTQAPGALLLNLYGSSEAAGDSLFYEVRHGEPRGLVPIGRPIANTQVYLLDPSGQPVPYGVPGEICIGGAGLARGYLGRLDLTTERFVMLAALDGAPRVYRTGDLGVLRADGTLEYAGRRDQQVKVRGFRIELGEVEAALRRHAGVLEAVVVGRPDARGDMQLVAYCVADADVPPSARDLRASLRDHLPAFMIPNAFMTLAALPLLPNGKVNRAALPTVENTLTSDRVYVAPRNPLEAQLSRIWEDVLDIRPVGMTDDFFDLGGHSLLAVRLFAEVERATGVALPVASMFASPTIEAQVDLLVREGWTPSWGSLLPLRTTGTRAPFYCVHEVDGHAFYYHALARYLGDNQPVYGLQALGLDGTTPTHNTIEEMAAHYIGEIQRVQPHGPYSLGGSSMGGLVAFEMARQLEARGETVDLLALFDTWSPAYARLLRPSIDIRIGRSLSALREVGPRRWLAALLDRVRSRRQRPQYDETPWFATRDEALKRLGAYRSAGGGVPLPPDLRDFCLREAMVAAANAYRPEPYSGRVVYFAAASQPERYYHAPHLTRQYLQDAGFVGYHQVDRLLAELQPLSWDGLSRGGLEVHVVPGPHGWMVREPHAKALAEVLRARLRESSPLQTRQSA